MDLDMFDDVISQCQKYTSEIACHLMGDPLTLSNLQEYLDIIAKYNLKAIITTSGFFIQNHHFDTLFHHAIKQINISLNSYNKNDTKLSFDEYITPIVNLCKAKQKYNPDIFINLRLWNIDSSMSDREYNSMVFDRVNSEFGCDLDIDEIYTTHVKSIRIDYKLLLHFDEYFQWPSLSNPISGDGRCLGLKSHIGILCSGVVVPCCLDDKGVINLGNIKNQSLDNILNSQKSLEIKRGFANGKAVEELCQRCSYKDRFILD
jgi:radical SAM protein with 4Fe4S-binding SPASM domain